MHIRFKKVRDGVVLSCLRGEDDAVVQRTAHGGFFALHDLMHYAVETVLGFDQAFFGLVAAGWDFATFQDKADPRYHALPHQALWAEHLVAILSRRHSDRAWQDAELLPVLAAEVNGELAVVLEAAKIPAFVVTPRQVTEIGARFEGLANRWAATAIGDHLELEFPA